MSPALGRLRRPYPCTHCSNVECGRSLGSGSAYLFRDLDSGQFCTLCEECRDLVQTYATTQFVLVAAKDILWVTNDETGERFRDDGQLGRLTWPFPVAHCAAADCQHPFVASDEAYLFYNAKTSGYCVFCSDCSMYAELLHRDWLLLVAI